MVPGALKGHVPTFPDEYFSCRRFPIFVFHIQRNPNTRVKIAFSETIGKRKKEEKILQISSLYWQEFGWEYLVLVPFIFLKAEDDGKACGCMQRASQNQLIDSTVDYTQRLDVSC